MFPQTVDASANVEVHAKILPLASVPSVVEMQGHQQNEPTDNVQG